MSRTVLVIGGVLAVALSVAAWRINQSARSSEVPFSTRNVPPVAAPICPWREPEHDLKAFFPGANRYELETRVLSGRRLELAEQLGRAPTGDENTLRVYPVYRDQTPLGAIMTRRVKGQSGAIELVLAVGADQQICGVRLQRLREPEASAAALQDSRWLSSFEGKHSGSAWDMQSEWQGMPAEARLSAEAIVEGARSLLVQLATATSDRPKGSVSEHAHGGGLPLSATRERGEGWER